MGAIKAPVKKTSEEILSQNQAVNAFNAEWDGYREPVLHHNGSELKQIQTMMEAYMKSTFGVDYRIGFYSERDISDRKSKGYVPLSVGKFPKGKWNSGIAMGMKLNNDVDGNIRWGSRGELIVCVIPAHILAKNQKQDRTNAKAAHSRHLGKGKEVKRNKDGDEIESTEVVIGKEKNHPVRH